MMPGDCPAYILAGGNSSRFGSDKARAEVQGQPQLQRIHRQLADLGHSVHIVADRASRYEAMGLSCLVDVAAERGPIAGLARALQHRHEADGPGWLLMVSCDQLIWRQAWFDQLGHGIDASVQAAVFATQEASGPPHLQPIPGLYHTDIASVVKLQIQNVELSLQGLLRCISHAPVCTSVNPRDWSFNTMLELQRLIDKLHRDGQTSGQETESQIKQPIVSYHQDEQHHWVAELACGHYQHVRHQPPLVERAWVLTEAGRKSMLGLELNCVKCVEGTDKDSV